MNNTNNDEAFTQLVDKLERQVDSVKKLESSDLELWKFYEERAERLSERLWNTGIWLMTILTAILATPFAANFVVPTEKCPYLLVKVPIATGLIAFIGMLFCWYAYMALKDMRKHIERNWIRAECILKDTEQINTEQIKCKDRKDYGWIVLLSVGIMSFAGFFFLFIFVISNLAIALKSLLIS